MITKRVENDLKPHNVETIKNILEIYKTSNKCCAIQATGTGKTFLILRLLEIYNDEGKSAVIFAPNREIIKQTKKRMKKFGLNNAIFYTYQKLARMTDEEISAMEFDLIVCDELHRTGAKTWGQKFEVLVNSHPDSKVFGVTATPLRCADGRDMAEEYFDGNKACDISLAEALVREIIPVMPLYVSALYTFAEEYQNTSEKIEKGNNSVEEKAELQKELLAAKQQLEKANGVPEVIKKYITNYNGKYLVFCKDKKHLYAMKDVVIGWFREAGYNGKIFEYPYYSNSSAVKKNLENFENNKEDGLKLLFIIDKLNEGLHLDEVHGCILLRTTVSNIIYYQQIGRAIDAGSMEQRVIFDLVSNFNSLKSFNLKKELAEKVQERRNGNFSDCSEDFELEKFDVADCVQECIDVFNKIDSNILQSTWTDSEVKYLVDNYEFGDTIKIANYLGRTKKSVCRKAEELKLKKFNIYTKENIEIIKKYYPIEGLKILNRFPKCVTKYQINNIVKKYNIENKVSIKQFSKEDDNFLIENFSSMEIEKICNILGRSIESVRNRAYRLGLKTDYFSIWTCQEIEILKKYYPVEGSDVYKRLNNKTKQSCQSKARKLNIKCNFKGREKYRHSKHKFVHYNKSTNSYEIIFVINGESKYIGSYKDEDEAGRVAMEKAKEYGKVI